MLVDVALPDTGSELAVLADTMTVLGNADDLANEFEAFLLDGPRDSGPPPHSHDWTEAFYVLDGEFDVTIGSDTRTCGPGSFAAMPAGTTHTFRITSDRARAIVITGGAKSSTFFADLAANVDLAVPFEQALPTIVEVAQRNGLRSPLFG